MWKNRITKRVASDENLKKQLLQNPKKILAEEFQLSLPNDVEVVILQDTPTKIHLTLPHPKWESSGSDELADEHLKMVSGGAQSIPRTWRLGRDVHPDGRWDWTISKDGGKTWDWPNPKERELYDLSMGGRVEL